MTRELSTDQNTLKQEGKTYKAVIGGTCKDCDLESRNCSVPCNPYEREDKQSVTFKEDKNEAEN